MLNINEDVLKAAIVTQACDQLLSDHHDLSAMVKKEVNARIDKIFIDKAKAQIESAINQAIVSSFDREYQRVTQWGEPHGPTTTIRAELDKTVNGYWGAKVDAKSGKPGDNYHSVTRAEYVMTQVCAEDFTTGMKSAVLGVTGALKDGLRNQIGKQMDSLLDELFRIKSLQDQGRVEKPY